MAYNKKHAQTYWQKKKQLGLSQEIGKRNAKNAKKFYYKNKDKLLEDRKKYMHENYVKCALIRIRSRCRRYNIPFDINPADVEMPTHCPVFNVPLIIKEGRGASDNSPSFDRIVPERGYVKGNVIVVSNKANRMKNSGSIDDLRLLLKYYESL